MEALVGILLGILLAAVVSGAILWVVGKLGLGLSVRSFGWAMLAGLIIGLLNGLANRLVPDATGLVGALVQLVISAVAIFAAGKLLRGMSVDGLGGALLAAVAIAAINFLLAGLLLASVPA